MRLTSSAVRLKRLKTGAAAFSKDKKNVYEIISTNLSLLKLHRELWLHSFDQSI